MKQTNSNGKLSLHSIGAGLGVACTFSFAGVFLGVLLVSGERIGGSGITIFLMIVHLLSSLLGCLITERFSASNKLLGCGITCLGYYLVLIMVACLFFDGISKSMWIGILPVFVAYLLAILWILKERPSNKSTKRRIMRR